MTIRMDEFWDRAVKSGLIPEAATAQVEQAFQTHQAGEALTPDSMAAFLVTHGRLTPFQADSLLATPPRPLRLGSFVIRTPETVFPFSKWIEASRPSDQTTGFLIRTVAGNEGLKKHASVSHPSLQPLDIEIVGDAWLVYSPIGAGATYALGDRTLSANLVCQWGASWAEALGQVHKAGLVHGQLSIHHLWSHAKRPTNDPGAPMLLRDPSGASIAADRWLDESALISSDCLAPELVSGNVATVATDFYSLGRMLYQLVEGSSAFANAEIGSNGLPTKIETAVSQGASGDPLLRVLGFAMAADPMQRIGDAETFAKALRAAQTSYDDAAASTNGKERLKNEAMTRPRSSANTLPASVSVEKQDTQAPKPAVPEAPREQAKTTQTSAAQTRTAQSSPAKSIPSASSPVEPEPIQSPTPHPAPPERTVVRRSRKRSLVGPIVLASMGLVVLGQLIYLAVVDPGPRVVMRDRPRLPPPDRIPPVRSSATSAPQANPPQVTEPSLGETASGLADGSDGSRDSAVPRYSLVDDDRLLFAPPPPTDAADAGSPPVVSLMPPGPSILISLRPQTWLDPSKSDLIVSAMQQEWGPWIESFAEKSGVGLDQIERLAVGLYPGRGGLPLVAYSLRLEKPIEIETLNANWNASEQAAVGSAMIRSFRSDDAAFLAWVGDDRQMTQDLFVGNESQANEVLESLGLGGDRDADGIEGAAGDGGEDQDVALEIEPGMAITMRRLWRGMRGDADLCIVLQPNFLFADGRSILENSVPAFEPAMRRMLVPDIAAMTLTAHATDQTYFWESRMLPAGRMTEAELLRRLESDVKSWPNLAESFLGDLSLRESWAGLVKRLPSMMEFAVGQTRFGISDAAVTINQYLPKQAAAQIGLAGLLAANAPNAETDAAATVEMTIEQILVHPITLAFNQESLKAAMASVQDEMSKSLPNGVQAPEIILMGGDLQKNGITQNQQIRNFDRTEAPLRDVLTDLVMQANPDKTVTASHQPNQMLVWIVDLSGERPVIRITTRDASVDRYDLPQEFQSQS